MKDSIKEVTHYLDWSKLGRHSVLIYLFMVILGYLFLQLGSIPSMIIYQYLNINPLSTIGVLYSFIFPLFFLLFFGWLVFGRPFFSIYAPSQKMLWKDFGIGVLFQWLISATFILLIVIIMPEKVVSYIGFKENLANEIPILLITVVGYLIQTSCEELYFRGYLMQATYRIIPFLPVVIALQGLLFGQLHIGNVKAWGDTFIAGIPYFLHACAFAYAAWRTGSLFFAWGLHFGNNSFLALFVASKGDAVTSIAPFAAEIASVNRLIVFSTIEIIILVLFLEIVYKNRYSSRSIWTMLTKKD